MLCLFGFWLISPKSYSAAGPHLGYFQHCWQGFRRGFHGSVLILRSSGLSDAATCQRGLVTIPRQPPPPMGHQGGELVKALSRGKLFARFGELSALSEGQSQRKKDFHSATAGRREPTPPLGVSPSTQLLSWEGGRSILGALADHLRFQHGDFQPWREPVRPGGRTC